MKTMLLLLAVSALASCSGMIRAAVRDVFDDLKCTIQCEGGAISTPVSFPWTSAILAGATFNPLTDWQYETPDFNGMVEILSRATAVGLLVTISSAGETLAQEGPVKSGGTAGVTPSDFDVKAVIGRVAPNQKIRIGYRNPTGGTITVDGILVLTPTGGARGGRRAPPRFSRRRR